MKISSRSIIKYSGEMKKDARIVEVLQWLDTTLHGQFVINDHWEADRSAVGIASPQNPQRLVYISTWKTSPNLFNVAFNVMPCTGSDRPFETVGEFKGINRDELLRLTKQHLGISLH